MPNGTRRTNPLARSVPMTLPRAILGGILWACLFWLALILTP